MLARVGSGEIVDVLRDGRPLETITVPTLGTKLPSSRWTRLCLYLNFPANTRFREAAARYRMRTWDAAHSADQHIALLEYRIVNVADLDDVTGDPATVFSLQIDPLAEGKYVDGLPEGEWIFRHANGNISSQGTYIAGIKQGRWQSFYADGSPESDGLFLDDQPHGAWRYWNEAGELITARYAYGRPIDDDATDLAPQP